MALFEDTFPPYVPFGSRTLVPLPTPATGTDVAVLQALYDLMGTMLPALTPAIPLSGAYDAATQDAVRKIQAYFGLPATGTVDAATYFLFGQGVGPHTTYGGPVYGSRTLQQGSTGGDVLILQNRLNLFRYASVLGGPADGVFGEKTRRAVLQFKADAVALGDTGFPPNAVVGSGAFDATWLYTFLGGRGLFPGRNGFDVVFLQVLLGQLGFFRGTATGFYDPATQAAVRAFQVQAGIPADGAVGPMTFYQLGLRNAVRPPYPFAVAWPQVSPSVTVSSVGLVSALTNLHPYGVASIVVNDAEGFESLDVTGNVLPDPGSFGGAFGQYAFTYVDDAGQLLFQQLMVRLGNDSGEGDWGGSVSVGVKTIPSGTVRVFPTPPGQATGPYGPAVLQGHLTAPTPQGAAAPTSP